jgi:hypothetical protein
MKKSTTIKIKSLVVFFLFLITVIAGEAAAATYYVSTSGSDSNPGTKSQPFGTIQKAANTVNPGNTVIVKNGTYTDTNGDGAVVNFNRGGTSGNWVTFKSENKWGAVIDGKNRSTKNGFTLNDNADYLRIEDFEIKDIKETGVKANSRADHVYFYRNHVHHSGNICTDSDSGKDGFYMSGKASYFTYDSNVIHHIGRLGPGEEGCSPGNGYWKNHDHGIYSNANNVIIINNVFYDNKRGWDIHVYTSGSNYEVLNNVFHQANPDRYGNVLIYADSSNWLIQNNIFIGSKAGIRNYNSSNSDILVQYNHFTGDKPYDNSYGLTFRDNTVGEDAKLVDITNNNYRPASSGSPVVNKALDHSLITLDQDGNARDGQPDIGAYEHNSGGQSEVDTVSPGSPTVTEVQ